MTAQPLTTQRAPQIGDTFWFVIPGSHGEAGAITKVGRTWLSTSIGIRIDRATLAVEKSAGALFSSQEHYAANQKLKLEWWLLPGDIRSFRMPKTMTLADIEKARALLGMPTIASRDAERAKARANAAKGKKAR